MPAFFSHVPQSRSQPISPPSTRKPASWTHLILALGCFLSPALFGQGTTCQVPTTQAAKGYYKDLLIDQGIGLGTQFNGQIADDLGLCYDELILNSDVEKQNRLLIGSGYDLNGILLYPDGEPRFRMVWVMGGFAPDHADSLDVDTNGNMEPDGRERFQAFFNAGGSYSGSCAGAFLADSHPSNDNFFELWTGFQGGSGHDLTMDDIHHDVEVPSNSPIASMPGIVNRTVLGQVLHIGGGFLAPSNRPLGTEILLTYKNMGGTAIPWMEGRPVCWAYKNPNNQTGRLVNIGSHPEVALNNDDRAIAKAMITYAMDGQGSLEVKTILSNGRPWCMNKGTLDNDPSHTRIGDKQYHHFKVELNQTSSIQIDLDEEAGWNSEAFDLQIYVSQTEFAFEGGANLVASDTTSGLTKTLVTPQLAPGTYYIGITCPNTVDYVSAGATNPYNGSVAVLNGVAYRIRATWGAQQPGPAFTNLADTYCTDASPVTLTGWPAGGTFQGPGVSGNTFSPSQLAPNTYTLSYTVDCTTVEKEVLVGLPPAPPSGTGIVQIRPVGSSPYTCKSAGVIIVTDSDPSHTGYQWEVLDPTSGSFQCPEENWVTFEFAPGVTSAQIRVSTVSDCAVSAPSSWLTIYY